MKNTTLLTFIIYILFSCSHKRLTLKDVEYTELQKSDCYSEYEEDKESDSEKIVRITKSTLGTSASYIVSGAGYTADYVLFLGGGVVVGLAVCSPVIALEGALDGNGRASGECIGRVAGHVAEVNVKNGMGKKAYSETRSWRCSEVDHISKGLRRVSQCFSRRGEHIKAKKQLNFILKDSLLKQCLSSDERKVVEGELEELERKLAL